MPNRVLIVPDKFKGTLTAHAAARAIARGWRRVRPKDRLTLVPMSDGGDGFGPVFKTLVGAATRRIKTVDATHRPCQAQWWWQPEARIAIVESANVIGLARLGRAQSHPFQRDTAGLAKVLRTVAERGARTCLVGIGGSATNDGGFGLAQALGWQFYDHVHQPILEWPDLVRLHTILPPGGSARRMKMVVAVDVQNRLLGSEGASRIYGPQKGLTPADMPRAERALGQLAAVVARDFNKPFHTLPGAGAAGGLGFGLMAFAGAKAVPGFKLFAQHAQLRRLIQDSDLVITGEGSVDRSSLMGKGVGEVARMARALDRPCIALGGVAKDRAVLRRWFRRVDALTPGLVGERRARSAPAACLARLAAKAAESYGEGS